MTKLRRQLTINQIICIVAFVLIGLGAIKQYDASLYFQTSMIKQLLHTRKYELDNFVYIIDKLIERDDDWETYDYLPMLNDFTTSLDELGSTHATFYSSNNFINDDVVIPLNKRTSLHDGTLVNLNDYPDVINQIRELYDKNVCEVTDKNFAEIMVKGVKVPDHKMYLYFRWIPTSKQDEMFVIVLGVSEHSIDNSAVDRFNLVSIGWTLFSLIVVSIAMILLTNRVRTLTECMKSECPNRVIEIK